MKNLVDITALHSGDLIFVKEKVQASPFDKAIALSTGTYTHVGIVEKAQDGLYILEATSKKGVVRTPWAEFIQENACFDVMRLKISIDIPATLQCAKQYLGRPYNFSFAFREEKIYCSQLVALSYRDKKGHALFPAKPMNFYDMNGNLPDFWRKLFTQLGESIPQGVLGTNPNDMAHSSLLTYVL